MTLADAIAFLRDEAARYEAEATAHLASHSSRESNSVREKKRAQSRALRRAADDLAGVAVPSPEQVETFLRHRGWLPSCFDTAFGGWVWFKGDTTLRLPQHADAKDYARCVAFIIRYFAEAERIAEPYIRREMLGEPQPPTTLPPPSELEQRRASLADRGPDAAFEPPIVPALDALGAPIPPGRTR